MNTIMNRDYYKESKCFAGTCKDDILESIVDTDAWIFAIRAFNS